MSHQTIKSLIHRHSDWIIVITLTLVGFILRIGWLDSKPPWMDEVATVVFSLGNRTQSIPTNQLLDIQTFLQPLQSNPSPSWITNWTRVLHYLFAEDNHPPTYFLLANPWLHWLTPPSQVVSVGVARSLAAIWGTVSIPLTYWLGRLVFSSSLAGWMGGMVMCTSPYSIFLSLEARHYTLAICCVILSLIGLVKTINHIRLYQPIPMKLIVMWLLVNALGLSVHYFFLLTLLSQVIVLFIIAWQYSQFTQPAGKTDWKRIYGFTIGSGTTVLLWVPAWFAFLGSNQTSGLRMTDMGSWLYWVNPLAQSVWTWVTAVIILPTDWVPVWVIVCSGVLMLLFLVVGFPRLLSGYKIYGKQHQVLASMRGVGLYLIIAIAIFFLISYGLGNDITRGGRYAFVYFPAIIVLVGGGLTGMWEQHQRRAIQVFWIVGLVSAATVISDVGYAKFYYPNRLLSTIQSESNHDVVLAIDAPVEDKPSVVGIELLSIAWEANRYPNFGQSPPSLRFVLINNADPQLIVQWLPNSNRPVDLWLLNRSTDLSRQNCQPVKGLALQEAGSYRYQHYVCS